MSNTVTTTLIIVVVVAGVLWAIITKILRRSESWTGTIIDKGFSDNVHSNMRNTSMNGNGTNISIGGISMGQQQYVTQSYYIVVKTDTGKEIRWPISEGLYNQFTIGDKLQKDSGTEIPRQIIV